MVFKLYIITDTENKILNFNNDNNDLNKTIDFSDIKYLSFFQLQFSFIIECSHRDNFFYINPYTGKFLKSTHHSTDEIRGASFTWQQHNGKEWKLFNKGNLIDIILHELEELDNIRIIWSNTALINANSINRIENDEYNIVNGFFIHRSLYDLEREKDQIFENEKKIVDIYTHKNKKIIITAGSQAAGKSSFFNYMNEEIVNFNEENYYNVDSDRYLDQFTFIKKMNIIPILYENYSKIYINSSKDLLNIMKSFIDDPHKNIEYNIEQYSLNNNCNFIKQGTSLWLNHISENRNFNNCSKQIILFWIDKKDMYFRLNKRLSNIYNIRYYFDVNDSINSYDNDWFNIADQIINIHFDLIFNDDKFSICFLFNDTGPDNAKDTMSCFDNLFNIIKQGIIENIFFIKLLIHLSVKSNEFSNISKDILERNNDSSFIIKDSKKMDYLVSKISVGNDKVVSPKTKKLIKKFTQKMREKVKSHKSHKGGNKIKYMNFSKKK